MIFKKFNISGFFEKPTVTRILRENIVRLYSNLAFTITAMVIRGTKFSFYSLGSSEFAPLLFEACCKLVYHL
jgi:hypothetical protein